jgi:Putative addiction module component
LNPALERRIEETMDIALPLEKMTIADKLRAMEMLWSDLTRDDGPFESPEWHGVVLRESAARVKDGKESFIDWKIVKKQLRSRAK